jgi:hypothetical protein
MRKNRTTRNKTKRNEKRRNCNKKEDGKRKRKKRKETKRNETKRAKASQVEPGLHIGQIAAGAQDPHLSELRASVYSESCDLSHTGSLLQDQPQVSGYALSYSLGCVRTPALLMWDRTSLFI